MAIVALVLAVIAFILATLEVSILSASVQQMIAAGLAFLALSFLIGSLPRAPRS